jgi:hypothetical protein
MAINEIVCMKGAYVYREPGKAVCHPESTRPRYLVCKGEEKSSNAYI